MQHPRRSSSSRIRPRRLRHQLVVRVLQSKRVGDAIEEREQRRGVNRLRDLWIGPAGLTDLLYVFVATSVRMLCEKFDKYQQFPFGGGEERIVEVSAAVGGDNLVVLALELQENAELRNSIRT